MCLCVIRYARLKLWEKFAVFYDKAFEVCKQLPASIHSLSGMAAFLECSVLLFKKELSNLSQDWKKIYKKTLQVFNALNQILKHSLCQIVK